MIVNHYCVSGGVILLQYLLLSVLYSTLNMNTDFIHGPTKGYEAVNEL